MTRPPARDPLSDLPTLKEIGRRLGDLERAERRLSGWPHAPRHWRPASAVCGGLAAALVAGVVLLETVGSAGALSIINRAPAAAAGSSTVQFNSTITVAVEGSPVQRFGERGAINFRTGDYRTTLTVGSAGGGLERRTAGGTFYIAQIPERLERTAGLHWLALRLAGHQRATFASAPERDAFTDPPVLFRAMAGTRAHPIAIRREVLGGVRTTHYRLSTTLAAFLRAAYPRTAGPKGLQSVPGTLDVWLDAEGRPRQVDETFAGASTSGSASISARISFADYGAKVTVSAPNPIAIISTRRGELPGPLVADPSVLFERLFFVKP